MDQIGPLLFVVLGTGMIFSQVPEPWKKFIPMPKHRSGEVPDAAKSFVGLFDKYWMICLNLAVMATGLDRGDEGNPHHTSSVPQAWQPFLPFTQPYVFILCVAVVMAYSMKFSVMIDVALFHLAALQTYISAGKSGVKEFLLTFAGLMVVSFLFGRPASAGRMAKPSKTRDTLITLTGFIATAIVVCEIFIMIGVVKGLPGPFRFVEKLKQ